MQKPNDTNRQRFADVWDAIEDTPQQAASMRVRSELMMGLTEVIREKGITQGDAAALFGVTQPRVSDLMRGKINLFSLDTLIDMAATAGMSPTVKASNPKVVKHARPKRGAAPERHARACPLRSSEALRVYH
jgi:predicted XRE-type DNA-binding protein